MLKLRFELSAEPFVYWAAILNQLRCSLTFAKHCYIRFYIKDTALSCSNILNKDCFEAEIITISAEIKFFEKLLLKVGRTMMKLAYQEMVLCTLYISSRIIALSTLEVTGKLVCYP